jgi:L-ascorbate metabolism protein UlaG (beta-lactamase superfamily)
VKVLKDSEIERHDFGAIGCLGLVVCHVRTIHDGAAKISRRGRGSTRGMRAPMTSIVVRHLGTATLVLEIDGLRLITDPALDPPGGLYGFGFGTRSTKLEGPALEAEALGPITLGLLSHDHHADNLDGAGRALLERLPRVLTTPSGAQRLARGPLAERVEGLAPFSAVEVLTPGGLPIRITATPARHGPPLSLPLAGEVIGFLLEWPGQVKGALYISGDTVWFGGVAELGRRARIGTAFLHLGGVRFGISGPLRYTFNAAEAVTAVKALGIKHLLPVHYDGWTHFRESRADAEKVFARASLDAELTWLTKGEPVTLEI